MSKLLLFPCDKCANQSEHVYWLSWNYPVKQICDDCFNKNPRYYQIHVLCEKWAWAYQEELVDYWNWANGV